VISGHGPSRRPWSPLAPAPFDFLEKPLSRDRAAVVEARGCRNPARDENQRLRENRRRGAHDRIEPGLWEGPGTGDAGPPHRCRVLLTGESGTAGAAGAHIHAQSPFASGRCQGECAAIPPDLIESELFGHERGAFTVRPRRGAANSELATENSFWMNAAICTLPRSQICCACCREGEFHRLAASSPSASRAAVIAATNRD